jgi:hypothetical protein
MTPDGRFIAFISGADDLVANDTNQQQDVFVRDFQNNSTALVSVNVNGVAAGTGDTSTFITFPNVRPSITDDGRYVSFTSKSPGFTNGNDTNGGVGPATDIFVRDRQSATTRLVSTNYSGDDSGAGFSGYPVITHDAKLVFYFSGASDLVGYDSNGGVQDLFVFLNVEPTGQVRFRTALTSANENSGSALITVSLTGPLSTSASINFSTANGTAISGVDYTSTSGTLTFAPGETEKSFSVHLIDDVLDEDDETIVLTLSSPTNVSFGEPNIAALKIVDDEPQPVLSVNDVTLAENDSGTTNAVFTISLSAISGRTVTVSIATQPVTATPGSDYQTRSTQLTFFPGQTIRQLAVPVIGDTNVESPESFVVNLGIPINATVARSQGVGTIIDDDSLLLLTETPSQRAIALDSVIFTRDVFAVTETFNFSSDQRTRVMIFATGLKLLAGENASAVTATAEDPLGNISPLSVEFVGPVPSFSWLNQVVLKLNDQPTSGDLKIRISLHGASSNVVLVGVRP